MGISEAEALAIARRAAELALAGRPAPSMVTLGQAAEILSVSRPTARKMLRWQANEIGRYPIEAVWRLRGPTGGPTERAS